MDADVVARRASQQGFSLIETIVALGILTVGVLGTSAVLGLGMQKLSSSPGDVTVSQKAAEAIEAVFSARDSHKLTWSQIRNVKGGSGSDGGIFLDGPQSLHTAGADGLVNTVDDDTGIETISLPGRDKTLGTADDVTVTLTGYTREIAIRDVSGEGGSLRSITVTITYQNGTATNTYVMSSFISSYS